MKKTWSYVGASGIFALLVCLLVYFLYSIEFWKAAIIALLAVVFQYFCWALFRFKTMISYSCSFIPAALILIYFVKSGYWWLVASIISLLLLMWIFNRERIDARGTTRAWVSTAIYFVVLSAMAALLV